LQAAQRSGKYWSHLCLLATRIPEPGRAGQCANGKRRSQPCALLSPQDLTRKSCCLVCAFGLPNGKCCPEMNQCSCCQLVFHLYKYRFDRLCLLSPCLVTWDVASRIFRGLASELVGPGLLSSARLHGQYALFFRFTNMHQRVALSSARGRSVSSWHGMPTASVKNKHFLN